MRLLILGGTGFLSAAVARVARDGGHDVTCLARGARLPPAGTRLLKGDRDQGHAAYAEVEGRWDAVVDISRTPRHVREALEVLGDRAGHWTFVSSMSVYAHHDDPAGSDESAELLPPLTEDAPFDWETYGEAKVTCEQLCQAALGDRVHLNRAGLIAGRGDPTDRYGYWPAAFARSGGGPVLVPDVPRASTQVIAVDDLARWLVEAAESGVTGALNASGDPVPFQTVVDLARRAAGSTGEQVPVEPEWLVEQQVGYWSGPDSLPLWLPASYRGFAARSSDAAVAAGLRLSPLQDLMAECLADERERGLDRERLAGLSRAREVELLALWAGHTEH
jgi:2'-hydroxyisoflavone reductase